MKYICLDVDILIYVKSVQRRNNMKIYDECKYCGHKQKINDYVKCDDCGEIIEYYRERYWYIDSLEKDIFKEVCKSCWDWYYYKKGL